jgi:tetratricopeptide (TPR) repeat protein
VITVWGVEVSVPDAEKPDANEQYSMPAQLGVRKVRSTHADLMRRIRQENPTGLNPAPLVRLSQVQPKRENRIALMLLRAAETQQNNHQAPTISLVRTSLMHTPVTLEQSLLEQLAQDSSTVDKAGVIQEVEHHLEQSEAPVLRAHFAGMLHQSYRAVEEQPNAITLLAHGRSLGELEPERALEVLQQALQLAETMQDAVQAQCLQEIIVTLMRLGRYRSACQWAKWSVETQPEAGVVQTKMLEVWRVAATLSGTVLVSEFKFETSQPARFDSALNQVDLLLAHNDHVAALELVQHLWQHNRQRLHLSTIALRLVPLLIATGQARAASEVAQHSFELSAGLHPLVQRNAQLVQAIALSATEPEASIPALEMALTAHTKPLDALNVARAGLRLAHVYEELGQADRARATLQAAQVGLAELSVMGRQMLDVRFIQQSIQASVGASVQQPVETVLELRFLGSSEARLGGTPVPLRRRFAEILAVLAMHPDGLSGEQLSLAIYGEQGTPECCKTELSRLRSLIPIETRPYRIGVPINADFLELAHCLETGQLEQAVRLHRGPLLPDSNAPEIVRQREHLSESLRRATLTQSNPDQLWHLAERDEHDLEIWQRLLKLLRRSDPRHAIAHARVIGLRRAWNL